MKCWICNNEAKTGEHKFKSSDLKRLYGKQFDDSLIIKLDNDELKLQGPNSNLVKHNSPICQKCNNDLTSPHDKAYDKFIIESTKSFEKLCKTKAINVIDIYGDNWKTELRNLYKYFAKQIGCRVAQFKGIDYPKSLSDFILNNKEIKSLKLSFHIKEGISALDWDMRNKNKESLKVLSNGATVSYGKTDFEEIFHGWFTYNWLTIHWIYSEKDLNQQMLQLCSNSIPIKVQSFDIKGRDEKENILDRFEYYRLRTEKERITFILDIINE